MEINHFRGQRQKDIRRRLIQGKVPSSQVEAAKKKKKQEEEEEEKEEEKEEEREEEKEQGEEQEKEKLEEEEELSCGILMWGWLSPAAGLLAALY